MPSQLVWKIENLALPEHFVGVRSDFRLSSHCFSYTKCIIWHTFEVGKGYSSLYSGSGFVPKLFRFLVLKNIAHVIYSEYVTFPRAVEAYFPHLLLNTEKIVRLLV